MPQPNDQLTLSLFDTTTLGLTLEALTGPSRPGPPHDDEPGDETAPPAVLPIDFQLAGDRNLEAGWKARAADTIGAIRLLEAIEQEGRPATRDEQMQLARFTGFGATDLATNLFRRPGEAVRPGWDELGQSLEAIVTEDELAGLARSTQYAHYTPEWLVRAMWAAVRQLGFAGGPVLEPGCGIGLFLALAPEAVRSALDFTGIEAEPISARIARILFPTARIRIEDFTKARLPERYALAIGNPPFSNRTVRAADPAGRLGLSLHDYIIARAVERLQPGGLAAFVTSRWTMDKGDETARRHIAGMADLVAAFRLPEGALQAVAGTDTVVDLLLLQRRASDAGAAGAVWNCLAEAVPKEEGGPALLVNRYFADHPEHVLGRHARASGPFGPTYTCTGETGLVLEQRLTSLLATLPKGICTLVPDRTRTSVAEPAVAVGTAAEGALIKERSFLIGADGTIQQIVDGQAVATAVRAGEGTAGIPARHAAILRGLIRVRDAVREVLRAQAEDRPWDAAQARLRVAYTGFTAAFGPLNLTTTSRVTNPKTGEATAVQRRPNLSPFLDDPDCWLVASIETFDPETGQAAKGPIFTDRVVRPPAQPVVRTAADALALVLEEHGTVDLPAIGEWLGSTEAEVLAELGDTVFKDPVTGSWQTADAYLSGLVRTKLVQAEAAASADPAFERNVLALRAAQPLDLRPSDITARLGAPWIPCADLERFTAEVLGVQACIRHTPEIASWSVDHAAFQGQASAVSEWGTSRRHAGFLLDDALHQAIPQIFDVVEEDGKERRVLNSEATEAAKEKLGKIRHAFERWVWTDPDRADRLTRLYNDRFNNLTPRHFDGSHLRLPGASSAISFRPHQKRGVWRILSAGSTYVAHSVGAGKTFLLAVSVMEQRRLGLVTKPMMVVPGHCLAQAAREFLQLYPEARILVADEHSFSAAKRHRFLARAATASWDCIIITHSAFKLIATPAAFERAMVRLQLDLYAGVLERTEADDRLTRKRLERLKEGLEEKLRQLSGRKDDMLTMAELGIDQLIVDEAQEFRKLTFTTNMSTLKGVDPDGSQRAWDLWVKTRYIVQRQPARALILASGTPITNTLGEMFTIQRFLAPEALVARDVHAFDAWAATFGETRTELELQPSGRYKPVTRFSHFVNVPELVAMFRTIADVVTKDDLRQQLDLPKIRGGKRQIVTAAASDAFRDYQAHLDRRIKAIEARKGQPKKGDDILLSVITDGRHAAIDLRLVDGTAPDEPTNKLNALISNVWRIWRDTGRDRYRDATGLPSALPGAGQLIFSDLGTTAVEARRGFSAYSWIRERLVGMGVPANQIAFMQDHRTSVAKQRLLADFNSGRVRILLGSSQTMGTGVNVQHRLKALHHLDVPWLPSEIEQREGRIERQGNAHEKILIYAYATLGSMDAPMWQANERKARFIAMALSGDRGIRRLEDAGSPADQFALAKAIASGDERLMRKAGLEAERARLRRLEAAHVDDQVAMRREVRHAEGMAAHAERRIEEVVADLRRRVATRGEAFAMRVEGRVFADRKQAGTALLIGVRRLERARTIGTTPLGSLGGFDLVLHGRKFGPTEHRATLYLQRTGADREIAVEPDLTPQGLVARLEHELGRFEGDLAQLRRQLAEATRRLADYRPRIGERFEMAEELEEKEQQLRRLEAELAADTELPAAA